MVSLPVILLKRNDWRSSVEGIATPVENKVVVRGDLTERDAESRSVLSGRELRDRPERHADITHGRTAGYPSECQPFTVRPQELGESRERVEAQNGPCLPVVRNRQKRRRPSSAPVPHIVAIHILQEGGLLHAASEEHRERLLDELR